MVAPVFVPVGCREDVEQTQSAIEGGCFPVARTWSDVCTAVPGGVQISITVPCLHKTW